MDKTFPRHPGSGWIGLQKASLAQRLATIWEKGDQVALLPERQTSAFSLVRSSSLKSHAAVEGADWRQDPDRSRIFFGFWFVVSKNPSEYRPGFCFAAESTRFKSGCLASGLGLLHRAFGQLGKMEMK